MHNPHKLSLILLATACSIYGALPQVDFDRMGKVGLAGAFAGIDLFQNQSVSFDPNTSTLFSRASDGSLSHLASTNPGGRILAGCALADKFYLAGVFDSVNGVSTKNIASYTPSSGTFTAVGSNGPNNQVDTLFCDMKGGQLWVGGRFTSPSSSIAVWDPSSNTWSPPPFVGLSGADSQVLSISTNSSDASLFFAGSFLTSFGNGSVTLNNTNNPNVPFSPGATPFTSSLVPVPLQNAQVIGSPSTIDPNFADIRNILCPSGSDGPGNSWFAADNSNPLITVRAFAFISANGVRLGNTFQSNRGTTKFSVTTIPDNTIQTLHFVDPITKQNQSCSDICPLSTDPSVLYQDFLFDSTKPITGVQIQLSEFIGSGPGLHILQILSSGAFASSIDSSNGVSCFAPNPSNTTQIGAWDEKQANTEIAGTTQKVLVSLVDVGTPASQGPSFTWIPYVSASGNYDISMSVPGCTNFQDCALRTTVKVTVFPGDGLQPWVTTISQQNTEDSSTIVYTGPIFPSSPNFVTTISMMLADTPDGSGQGGKYELVADRVQLILKSADIPTHNSGDTGDTGPLSNVQQGFGFFEWPRNSQSFDGTQNIPASSQTSLDTVGTALFAGFGNLSNPTSSSSPRIEAVAHHQSGLIVLGGSFLISSGAAASSANIVGFRNGALVGLAEGGLNGEVTSFVLSGDKLFVGGSFTDTKSGSSKSSLGGIAVYNVQSNSWSPLGAGTDGDVTDLGLINGQIQVAGNFSKTFMSPDKDFSIDSPGFSAWDINKGAWASTGGFLAGGITFVGNGSSSQFIAGNVAAFKKFGASGMVMLQNGNDGPKITPLGVELGSPNPTTPSLNVERRFPTTEVLKSSSRMLINLFSRQSANQIPTLPPSLPAPAPAILSGVFWTNTSSSKELAIIGGNFSFFTPQLSSSSEAVAIYDPTSTTISSLLGTQINGTVRTLLVDGNHLYVGGQFTLQGTNLNGLVIYDLEKQQWDNDGLQGLQTDAGSSVVVRSITKSSFKANIIIVAGSFAQAGSLACQSICLFDTDSRQWNALGGGIHGEVSSVAYAGKDQELLIAAGTVSLSSTVAYVAQYSLTNDTWTAVGQSADIPGPVTAVEVNGGNENSIFAAGQSNSGSAPFLVFWDGIKWSQQGLTLGSATSVSQLTMVPLQDTHTANGIIEPDRMLMMSGSFSDPSFGNVSSALYDGQNFIPYIVSTSSTGSSGVLSSLFHSFATFSFNSRRFLATGVVILISIAISAGIVFLLALIGILWTLFSRHDDKLNKFDPAEEDDDDSTHHRPSSLLEHINAATRTTILGTSPFSQHNGDKSPRENQDQDPFGPDASNYVRAETPSDAIGGILSEEQSRPAHARYSFDGTGEGELPISAGAEVEVLDDRDPAWWYARDVRTGREGVVPAAYLY